MLTSVAGDTGGTSQPLGTAERKARLTKGWVSDRTRVTRDTRVTFPHFPFFALLFLLPINTLAQERVMTEGGALIGQGVSQPVVFILILLGLALLPIVAMMTTAFVKLTVVLSMLRNALGTQQIPPTPIITGLALIMTLYIMTPVGAEMYRAAEDTIKQGTGQPLLSQTSVNLLVKGMGEAKEPMRGFLKKHVHRSEQKLFFQMAQKMMAGQATAAESEEASAQSARDGGGSSGSATGGGDASPHDDEIAVGTQEGEAKGVSPDDFMVLIPAFVISELVEAFQISFIIFLPFLIIDIVVTNILLALGMFMVPPITISLPFKLLLFVVVDGWHILSRALLMGYV